MSRQGGVTAAAYRALAEFRYQIRRYLRFSEEAVRAAGLEPQQHQLLLLLKGLPEGVQPRIGEVAEPACRSSTTAPWNWWTDWFAVVW